MYDYRGGGEGKLGVNGEEGRLKRDVKINGEEVVMIWKDRGY